MIDNPLLKEKTHQLSKLISILAFSPSPLLPLHREVFAFQVLHMLLECPNKTNHGHYNDPYQRDHLLQKVHSLLIVQLAVDDS
jgi:hypothetical protein